MDFIILKVNGQDLSKASHEEAVEAFRTAKEPIVVEVLRRSSTSKTSMTSQATDLSGSQTSRTTAVLVDATTQTEWDSEWEFSRVPTPPPDLYSLKSSAPDSPSRKAESEVYTEVDFISNEQEQDDSFEDLRNYEIEYEEVTLNRTTSNDKLGLTLCYGSGDDMETAIFIGEIDPCGIAAKDGRIREGDQILQINGIDVRTRNQAIALFSEDKQDITLLVARPQIQMEDFLDDPYLLDHHTLLQVHPEEDEDNLTDGGLGEEEGPCNNHEKDSGVGRTDESTRNDESSEHEYCHSPAEQQDRPAKDTCSPHHHEELDNETEMTTSVATTTIGLNEPIHHADSDGSIDKELALLSQEMEHIQLECQSIVKAHEQNEDGSKGKERHTVSTSPEHIYSNLPIIPPASLGGRSSRSSGSRSSLSSKVEAVEQWVKSTNAANAGRKGSSRLFVIGGCCDEKDSSSAYNTGESCRSTPLTLELGHTPGEENSGGVRDSTLILSAPRTEDKGTQLNVDSDAYSVYSCESCRRCLRLPYPPATPPLPNPPPPPLPPPRGREKGGRHAKGNDSEKNRNYVTLVPSETMYTNEANLEHTIWLQQQLFRQALLQQQRLQAIQRTLAPSSPHRFPPMIQPNNSAQKLFHNSSSAVPSSLVNNSYSPNNGNGDEPVQMEWKVKRRADGSRYITRRPVRNRILRERANRIMEERALTTDDDAMSELKIGRYWSKEERKRHLERAKDQKRRREAILKMRMDAARGGSVDSKETPSSQQHQQQQHQNPQPPSHPSNNILELSHKKMMRKKGRTLFDDFTTVQEVLAHGSRGSQSGTKVLGLLSVTTV